MELSHLDAFVAVARAKNFRRAAIRAGISASALSAAVRALEDRLGVLLLHRTTRSVTPTEAGQRLLDQLGPALDAVTAAVDAARDLAATPTGRLRINSASGPARLALAGLVGPFLLAHPGITLEIVEDDSFVDIVAAGFDAGVRYEEHLAQDVVAVPLGPPQRFVVVAAPAHLAAHGTPTHPDELRGRPMIAHRFSSGASPPWEFARDGQTLFVPARGPLITSSTDVALRAAADGLGFAYVFDGFAAPWTQRGALVEVLAEWSVRFTGPLIYTPARRLMPAPLRAFIDFVRSRSR